MAFTIDINIYVYPQGPQGPQKVSSIKSLKIQTLPSILDIFSPANIRNGFRIKL